MEKSERLLELGGTKKDIALLAIGGIAQVAAAPLRPGVDRSRTVRRADRAGGNHRARDGI